MPIINGVEVEGCSYYNIENEPYACEIWNNECCAQDCYWKQLQRAKAENEKLEQENKELTHYLACMTEQRNKANTTLQKIKEIVIEPCIDGESCETCNSNCTNKDILTLIKKAEEE